MAKLLRRTRRVLVDVNTQYDLICRNGHDQNGMLRNIRRLFAWARVERIPVVSLTLSRRAVSCPQLLTEQETLCTENTPGQKKIRYTMLMNNILFGPDNRMDLPRHLLQDYQQIILETRSEDPFSLPRADRLLSEMRADEFVVFGVGLDSGIKHTALGLMRRRKKVAVVADALDWYTGKAFDMGLRKLEIKGARVIKTAEVAGASRLHGQAGNRRPWRADLLINARIN